MKHILIVYHSQSGTTEQLLKPAVASLQQAGEVALVVKRAVDASARDVINADLLLIAASENCGHMNGGIKEFLDRIYYPVTDKVVAMPYAIAISAGNDGRNAVKEISKYLNSLGMKNIAEPLIVRGEYTSSNAEHVNELAQTLSAGLSMGIF